MSTPQKPSERIEEIEWKCHCGSLSIGDTRCGYCKTTLKDYLDETHEQTYGK